MPPQQLLKWQEARMEDVHVRNDSFLQRLFLTYVYRMVRLGRKGRLQQDELRMPRDQACEAAFARFQAAWAVEKQLHRGGGKANLLRALRRAFGLEVALAGMWKLCWSVLVILGAFYFVRSLIQYVSDPVQFPNMYNADPIPSQGVGWILAVAFFVDSALVGTALQRMSDCCVRTGIKIRAALMSEVYRKTFRLASVHVEGAGSVTSLVATDCSKLYDGVLHLHNVWTAPLETLAIIALLLAITRGIFGLPILLILMVGLPLQYWMGLRIARLKLQTVEAADRRVQGMQEILLAIKLVKFYVWESSFAQQVSEVRRKEVGSMSRAALIKTFNLCLVFAVPPVVFLLVAATYVFAYRPLDAVFAFTVVSLFNTLRFPLVVLPKALRGTSEALMAVTRLQHYLLLEEGDNQGTSETVEASFKDAQFVYGDDKNGFKLSIPKLSVLPGEVCAIVGRVSAGKSSVFQAILKNMRLVQGERIVGGRCSYVPQTPWIQNLSIRDNILFGLPYEEAKYKHVIHACALELDLQILPHGDQAIAGERGINLSGGQRQRVGLARAAYHDAGLVLLDNPLSAVDQHTAVHIFTHCIRGLLREKAVLWITHQLDLLELCDNMAVMDSGTVTYFGAYKPDIIQKHLPNDHLLFATVEAGDAAVAMEDIPEEEPKVAIEPGVEAVLPDAQVEQAQVEQTWPRTAAASPFAAASLHHGFPSTQWSSDTTSSSSSSSSASIPGSPPSHALSRAQANEQSDNAIKAAGNNEAVVPGAGVPLPGPGSPYGAGGGWLREWGGQQRAAVKEGCGVGWGMHGVPTKQQQQQQQQQQQHASAEEHANALHGSPIKRHATQLQRSADDALPKDVSASTEQNQMVDLPSDVHSLAPGPLPSRNLPPRLMLLQAPHSKPLHAPPAATSTPPSSQSPFSSVSPFLQIQGFRGPLSSTPPVAHAPPATPSGSFQHLAHPIEHTPCTSIAPLPPVTSQLERQGNSQLSRSLSYPASTPSPILRPPASNPPAPTKLVRKSTSGLRMEETSATPQARPPSPQHQRTALYSSRRRALFSHNAASDTSVAPAGGASVHITQALAPPPEVGPCPPSPSGAAPSNNPANQQAGQQHQHTGAAFSTPPHQHTDQGGTLDQHLDRGRQHTDQGDTLNQHAGQRHQGHTLDQHAGQGGQ
eukprot:CAMPEP_0202375816 /NCGR_PEP_ID=MMETSP1127-20130417/6425_1 /ASSEMBLY_ACC=CAM_ASM_000462 /TAXON_ID=3047 /ORGANISM="Dunaliella tertiolecta, Strain CCMP1320" /LENGTH=1161 /DNA_ID=CAMNT_0048973417 /DNA_START=187 /DNA_END=3669 /DNA_ORIENTATION=+